MDAANANKFYSQCLHRSAIKRAETMSEKFKLNEARLQTQKSRAEAAGATPREKKLAEIAQESIENRKTRIQAEQKRLQQDQDNLFPSAYPEQYRIIEGLKLSAIRQVNPLD